MKQHVWSFVRLLLPNHCALLFCCCVHVFPSPVSCAKCFSSLYPTTRRQLSTPMGGRALHLISFVHSLCIEKETHPLRIQKQIQIQIQNTK